MNKIRIFATILFFASFVSNVEAQSYKFLTTGFSVLEKNEKGGWGKWSDVQEASITVTLDTKKDRIVVYSQELQLYKIVEYQKEQETEDDLIYPFVCAGEDGEPVTISIITRKKQNNRKQLYITHRDVILVYNIINYPETDLKK